MFDDPLDRTPVTSLSGVEAYIVCAAAYLHDIGMVVAETEKLAIVQSEDWAHWIRENAEAAALHDEIELMRSRSAADPAAMLVADRQYRFLIGEYARRRHHERSVRLMHSSQAALGRFAYDDPQLLRAIEDVCCAHGLAVSALEDPVNYPTQSLDIRTEKADMRFLASLLRIGDLLDLRHARGCPLLMNAAAPLPRESIAHWSQYQRIEQFAVSPRQILIHARCQTQLEHRVLRDWCDWIESECNFARRLTLTTDRHRQWQPPQVTHGAQGILIEPAADARYVHTDWKLEFDEDEILDRLIHDVHGRGFGYVRELIQNALDAMRCRLYAEMGNAGEAIPAFPNEAPDLWRQRYRLIVKIDTVERPGNLSDGVEERDVLEITDDGVGMTPEIIEKYFLQVGRSYYTTEDFARRYSFIPTSRFGIGFLSVFSVAEAVSVTTRHLDVAPTDAIELALDRPRSYFLRERTARARPGTTVRVVLADRIDIDALAEFVRELCQRVEFDVVLELGERPAEIISCETADRFTALVRDVSVEGGRFEVRAYPVDVTGVYGDVLVFVRHLPDEGEDWAAHGWANSTYLASYPLAIVPQLPWSSYCLNGLHAGQLISDGPLADPHLGGPRFRGDVRRQTDRPNIARATGAHVESPERDLTLQRDLTMNLREILAQHLSDVREARPESMPRYCQRLMRLWDDPEFWLRQPETVEFLTGEVMSIDDASAVAEIPVQVTLERLYGWDHIDAESEDWDDSTSFFRPAFGVEQVGENTRPPKLDDVSVQQLSNLARGALFSDRHVASLEVASVDRVIAVWCRGEPVSVVGGSGDSDQTAELVDFPDGIDIFSVRLHSTADPVYDYAVLNAASPWARWLRDVERACVSGEHGLDRAQWGRLWKLFRTPIWHTGHELDLANSFVERWRDLDLPQELLPPERGLGRSQFVGGKDR